VDYIVVGAILSQVFLVALLTGSPIVTLLMFVASIMNAVFAVTVALWFSRLFHRNLMRGGRSKSSTILRLVFIVMWGSLLLGVGLLLSVPWYIVPQLEIALHGTQLSNLSFFIIYPFSAGTALTNLVYPNAGSSAVLVASGAMIGYFVLAGIAAKWSIETVKHMSKHAGVKIARVQTQDFSIKTHSPVLGYVIKDLRISSRSPATAFFFALPVLETLIVSLLIASFQVLKVSAVLVATVTGGILALLMPLALLTAEGRGLEYAKTLPVNANRIVASKALVSTVAYVPVPLTLLGLSFMKQSTSPIAIVIPFLTILAIASASVFEIKLFLHYAAEGKIAAVIRDAEKLVAGATIILAPEIAYAISYLMLRDHVSAILAMGGTAVVELLLALHVLRAS
jgi:predicted permease